MRVTAIFPDGAAYSSPTFMGLEDTLRSDAWNPSRHEEFRIEMVRRAKNWSGAKIRIEKSSAAFLQALEAAGMIRLEIEYDEEDQG